MHLWMRFSVPKLCPKSRLMGTAMCIQLVNLKVGESKLVVSEEQGESNLAPAKALRQFLSGTPKRL